MTNIVDWSSMDFFGLSGNQQIINDVLKNVSNVGFNSTYPCTALEEMISKIYFLEKTIVCESSSIALFLVLSSLIEKNPNVVLIFEESISPKSKIWIDCVKCRRRIIASGNEKLLRDALREEVNVQKIVFVEDRNYLNDKKNSLSGLESVCIDSGTILIVYNFDITDVNFIPKKLDTIVISDFRGIGLNCNGAGGSISSDVQQINKITVSDAFTKIWCLPNLLVAEGVKCALQLFISRPDFIGKQNAILKITKQVLEDGGFYCEESDGRFLSLKINSNEVLVTICDKLLQLGIKVGCFKAPLAPANEGRICIVPTINHTEAMVKDLLNGLTAMLL